MLELSIPMQFVMVRAASEAVAVKTRRIRAEHIFLGLLKLSELNAEALVPGKEGALAIEREIDAVKAIFKKYDVETLSTRALLRRALLNENASPIDDNEEVKIAALLAIANNAAEQEKLWKIGANLLLNAIFENPPPLVAELCHLQGKQPAKESGDKSSDVKSEGKKGKIAGREFIPELTARVRKMRCVLLEKIFGQDHAVHTFAEGIFNSELLAQADEKRQRPRAIFVFAGPPGVGKTFLAEQAAEALEIPFKRFDMSGYSDHQQHLDMVGFPPSFQAAKEGCLTGFVKKNPRCMLLFDEIEKAHLNSIQLFLQILDAGTLQDKFTDKSVAFRDTIIIFTTNAGRQLYEGDNKGNCAGIPRKTILNALETDTHPQTGKPFFPAAICSRLATGWPLMFNHLDPHNLETISAGEFKRCADLFQKQYNIKVESDDLLATALLFQEGGHADARTLRAQSEIFFKSEIFKLCRLFNAESFEKVIAQINLIRFVVETKGLPEDVARLFTCTEQPEILLFAAPDFADLCRKNMPGYVWYDTLDADTAFKLLSEHDIRLTLLQPDGNGGKPGLTGLRGTMRNFDHVPLAASILQTGRRFFRNLCERMPEMPVYLLESPDFLIDEELEMSFVRAGARGKLLMPEENFAVLEEDIGKIAKQLYLQHIASSMASERKVLKFDSAPTLDNNKHRVNIRIRDLSLKRALDADDANDVLDDVEKPSVRFDDVIGATGAKDELKFFIDYLKNPKKFVALGLKPPKGVLLHGPPGTGKTMLAKAMAGESDVAFISADASSFVTKWQGSGQESIRNLFKRARRYAPSIVFIDEIDAIGRARGGGDSGHGEEMALNALLTEMDGFSVDPKRPVFVLAATNFEVEDGKGGMGQIDPALARRFDRKILVDLPDKDARRKYLELKLSRRKDCQVTPEMIEQLAGRSTGMSLSIIESVIELAARMAAKKLGPLTNELLEEAFELSVHGEEKHWGIEYMERVARHESGHAFMYWRAGNTPAYLTIVARGGHGGYMEHSDDDSSAPLKTRVELIDNIRTSLGGRAAEIVYYGEEGGISSGASGDLQNATRIARAMICNYGMDDAIGLAVLSPEEASRGPMAAKISERISEIIKREMYATVKIITESQSQLDKLVTALLDKNRLTSEEINNILGKPDKPPVT